MKKVSILSVCGAGTVTSSMIAGALKRKLRDTYDVSAIEAKLTEALELARSGRFDLITYTSPLPEGDYGIPAINALPCLTGVGEDKFFEDVIKMIEKELPE